MKFAVLKNIIVPMLVKTKLMVADVFTKPVDEETFEFCKHEKRNMQRGSVMSERVRRMRGAPIWPTPL